VTTLHSLAAVFSTSIAVTTTIYGVVMALAPLLQIRTIVRSRSSAGVSLGYFRVLAIGFVLWLVYGLDRRDPVLIIANTVALAATIAAIAVALRFRPRD
jgi:MtN3 and saliva related transmembrane protein